MRGTRHAFAAVLLAVLACAAAAPALAEEQRIALVIGNSAYADSPLTNPVNDARLMSEVLRAQGFEVVERLDVGQIAMKLAVKDFGTRLKAAQGAAVGLFFYAGHGIQVDGENYLVPVDAPIEDEGDVDIYAVSANAILRTIEDARNGLNIVILDACRNNPFARSFRAQVRGLARMDAPQGTLIAYSTAPGDVALDGDGANSPYTEALAKAIGEPGVLVEQMFKRVRIAVLESTRGKQTSWEASSLTTDFYMAGAAVEGEAKPAPPLAPTIDDLAMELAFWQSIEESGDIRQFEAYLLTYPQGVFAGIARLKIERLGETDVAVVTPPRRPALNTAAREALLIDFATGAVLLEKDADLPIPPASMSKLMTVYMVFERLAAGTLALDDTMPVSEKAWRVGGSKSFVKVDTDVTVEDLLRGIIVQSGNDACIVVAEALAGSEEAFAIAMTKRAREIGLTDSVFANATGWPHPDHRMTARDLVTLTRRIITDFPEYFPYFAEKSFTYNDIRQGNRNPLLYKNIGADGMKTGHTAEAGYSLTATAERGGRRLILVITGLESASARSNEAERILDWGFRVQAETAGAPLPKP